MSDLYGNARLDALMRQHAPSRAAPDSGFLYWICIPAIMFSVLGMLFAINFGVSLIAIALAILYYYQFGYKIAAAMAATLLAMLTVWMMVMPAHHLVLASLGIFLAAIAGQILGGAHAGQGRPGLAWVRRTILAGPVYAMVMFREKLVKNPGL